MSARDVIAPVVYQKMLGPAMDQEPVSQVWKTGSFDVADAILTALTAAGYQIASPGDRIVKAGEWDAETVEICAGIVDSLAAGSDVMGGQVSSGGIRKLGVAIRTLTKEDRSNG